MTAFTLNWTGPCFKTGGYSIFHKDETALLNPPCEVLFFQTFGLDQAVLDAYVPPPAPLYEESWYSKEYDARWRLTTILMPNCIGHGLSHPLSWEVLGELTLKREEADRAIEASLLALDQENVPAAPPVLS